MEQTIRTPFWGSSSSIRTWRPFKSRRSPCRTTTRSLEKLSRAWSLCKPSRVPMMCMAAVSIFAELTLSPHAIRLRSFRRTPSPGGLFPPPAGSSSVGLSGDRLSRTSCSFSVTTRARGRKSALPTCSQFRPPRCCRLARRPPGIAI